jgi:multiple sugar transport system permease protein
MRCAAAEHPSGAGKRRRPLEAALAFPRPGGGHRLWGYLFLLPILVLLIVFKFLPMLRALYLSFTSYDLLNPPRFVGLQNYLTLIHDPLFHQSVGATAYYVLGTCIPVWFVSLALALALDAALPAGRLLRLMLVIPAIVPVVVYATIWRFMLHPYGLVNTGLQAIGLPAINWLADSRAIMPGVILASEWRFVPYFMVIYLAGLQGIPREYHEAAAIDGASRWERFRFVTLPLLRPTILLVVVVSMVLTSKVFTNVLIISGGGPDGATRVLSLFIYQTGFQYLKMGLASAASVLLLLATMAFTLVQLRLLGEDTRG